LKQTILFAIPLPLYDAAQYCSHEKDSLFSQFLFLLWQKTAQHWKVIFLLTGPIGSSSSCPLNRSEWPLSLQPA
jgi:hypothetical protein